MERILKYLPRVYKQKLRGVLYALLYSLTQLFAEFDADFQLLLAETSILTASGFFLNLWGYYFKVTRYPGEEDEEYRQRLRLFLINGTNTHKAILDAVRPFSVTEPALTEYNQEVLVGDDYSGYVYQDAFLKNAFILRLTYRPETMGESTFYLDKAFLDTSVCLTDPAKSNYNAQRVEEIASGMKMGGIKLVFKAQ